MSDFWGNKIKLGIFGESHGPAVGVVIDGVPPGLELDLDLINAEMLRRAPGRGRSSTSRRENDAVEILSGFFSGKTTGSALCGLIRNSDAHSSDYEEIKKFLRPGHADYTGAIRYRGFNDYRGGGHFSGRLTAPLLFAGAVCKQFLLRGGIRVFGRVKRIAGIEDMEISYEKLPPYEVFQKAAEREVPALNDLLAGRMLARILEAKKEADSVGGVLELFATGLPAGLGNPFFDSIESEIAHLAFSVPAVKGIEFGLGFGFADQKGSEANDPFYFEDGKIITGTNNNGGILGGITSGMPLVYRVALKPTPSVGVRQRTVDVEKMEGAEFSVKGRHDPCVAVRALPVMEAVTAVALADFLV
ncbi:MAG: chorismate synthase [Oscillospiraceae bacterium]|jgi:chorismate synthase|nr:chorismate synthase [Oscillospiraceae bacterium]